MAFSLKFEIVALWTLLLQVVPIGKESEVVLEALEKLSTHKLGRAAIGHASIRRQGMVKSIEEATTDSGKSQAVNNGSVPELAVEKTEEQKRSIFGDVWQRIRSSLEYEKCAGTLVIGVIRHLAKLAIVLSAAGKRFDQYAVLFGYSFREILCFCRCFEITRLGFLVDQMGGMDC